MAVLRCVAAAVLLLASLPATALGVADVTRDGNGVITIIGDGGTDALTVSTVPGPQHVITSAPGGLTNSSGSCGGSAVPVAMVTCTVGAEASPSTCPLATTRSLPTAP